MVFDSKLQRKIMGGFATGVTVVTCRVGDELHGMTANAVTSVSLDPPLVLVAVAKSAGFHAQLSAAGSFAMNILTAEQEELSNRFAMKGAKPFDDIPLQTSETGTPVFAEGLGFVECKVAEVLAGGDHDIFLGEIVAGEARDGEPLLYFAGGYRRISG
ncbi:MAG: flavin reductase family protein [Planctomycetales bacterium]|nr:flavin reductase family protein [Planctomycetales bacterium]